MQRNELETALDGHPLFRLFRLGWVNLGSHTEPHWEHCALFLEREAVEGSGRRYATVPLNPELLEEAPEVLPEILLGEAERAFEGLIGSAR